MAPLSVVLPTVTRVTLETPLAVVPRLRTATVKLTAAPTAGFDGFDETLEHLQVRAGRLGDDQLRGGA